MSVTTIHKCDNCGDSWDASEHRSPAGVVRQLWSVSVAARWVTTPNHRNQVHASPEVQWCRPCVDRLDALGQTLKAPKPEPEQAPSVPPPTAFETIDRILREIAREEAEQVVIERSTS